MKIKMLDAKEIAEAISSASKTITPRAIQMRAKRESWPYEERTARGGKKRLYPVQQIPNNEIRQKIIQDSPCESALKEDPQDHQAIVKLSKRLHQKYNPSQIPKRHQKIGKARADMVEVFMTEREIARRAGLPVVKTMEKWLEDFNAGRHYRVIGFRIREHDDKPVTLRRMYEWIANYERYGWTALCGYRYPYNKGNNSITETEMKLLLALALNSNRMPIAMCCRITQERLLAKGLDVKSIKTYSRWLKRWRKKNNHLWVAAREGEKAVKDRVVNYLERDYDSIEVGEVVVADGHITNFKVIDPYTGKEKRMMLIMFYDMKSRFPLGWEIMPTESTQGILSALYNSIKTLGKVPRVVILDNGKAFKSKVFINKGEEFDLSQAGIRGIYYEIGVEHVVFAWPYNARAKTIERFFGEFAEFEMHMPSYTGRSIDDKPAQLRRNEKKHKRLFNADIVYSVDDTNEAIAYWIEHVYGNRPKRALGGRTPKEVFSEGRGEGIADEELASRMLMRDKAVVQNQCVRRFGRRYENEELRRIHGEVEIRFSLQNLNEMYVFHEGDYIGVARVTSKFPVVARGNDMESLKLEKALKKMNGATSEIMNDMVDLVEELRGFSSQFDKPLMETAHKVAGTLRYQQAGAVNLDEYFSRPAERLPEIVQMAAEISEAKEQKALPSPDRTEYKPEEVTLELDEDVQPLFEFPYERYEWLIKERDERPLTGEEKQFIQEFEDQARKIPSMRECFGL